MTPAEEDMKTRSAKSLTVIAINLALSVILSGCRGAKGPSAATEDVVVGAYKGEYSALIYVAEEKGFFRNLGLSVKLVDFESGPAAIEALLAGRLDIGTAADYPTAKSILKGSRLLVLTGIGRGNSIQVVCRRDHGIVKPEDLAGKRIAVPFASQAEFYLGLFLAEHRIGWNGIERIDTAPSELLRTLESGRADAVIAWEPWIYAIKKALGGSVSSWDAQSDHEFYFLTLTRPDVVERKAGALDRFVAALVKAEAHAVRSPSSTQRLVMARTGLPDEYMRAIWPRFRPSVFLSQGLVATLEAEAAWLSNVEMPGVRLSNVLSFFHRASLKKAKADADTIVE
jgi:NitT/TauT family transport system substrate-binding protein